MFTTASSTAVLTTAFSDVGGLVLLVVGAVLGGWAALVGLKFGVTRVKRYITGGKF